MSQVYEFEDLVASNVLISQGVSAIEIANRQIELPEGMRKELWKAISILNDTNEYLRRERYKLVRQLRVEESSPAPRKQADGR